MMMPNLYVFGLWIVWTLQFVVFRAKQRSTPVKTAPNSRWGIILQVLGYWAIFLPARISLIQPVGTWRFVTGTAFGLVGIWLASTGVRHLGKQWRMVAALNHDHQLVTSGPYRVVRHPIYTSMLAMFIMSALFLGRLPWWPIGMALFLAGIEIRIHEEDRLLRDRFGSLFEEWKREVPSYLPVVRRRHKALKLQMRHGADKSTH
jgi:protein-S-isoprenylcysteine O-methyltransferase Ste14